MTTTKIHHTSRSGQEPSLTAVTGEIHHRGDDGASVSQVEYSCLLAVQNDIGPLKKPESCLSGMPLLRWKREIRTNQKGEEFYHYYIKGVPR